MSNDDDRGLPNRGRANAYRGYSPDATQLQKVRFRPIGVDIVGTYVAFGVELYYAYNADLSDAAPLQGANIIKPAYIFPSNADNVYRISYYIDSPNFRGGADYIEDSGSFIAGGAAIDWTQLRPSQEHTIGARIETVDGDIGLLLAYCTVSVTNNNEGQVGVISADRNTSLVLTGQAGSTIPDLIFNLSYSTNEAVTFAVSDNASWMSGAIVDNVLTLSFGGVSALAAGAYSAAATVTVSGASITPQPLDISVSLTVTSAVAYTMVLSDSTSFTNPLAVNNAVLTGSVAIGLLPTTGISSVQWSIDGVVQKTRTGTPWDLGAESAATAAVLYDTSALTNGDHTIEAVVTPSGGAQNRILQSETPNNATWVKNGTTGNAGDTTAGVANQTLMYLSLGAATGQHYIQQSIAKTSAAAKDFSLRVWFKLKAGQEQYFWRLNLAAENTVANCARCNINLQTLVISNRTTTGIGWTVDSAASTLTDLGGGIYLADLKGTTDAASVAWCHLAALQTDGGATNWTVAPSGTTGAYVAFAFDETKTPTAYTATTTTAVTGSGGTPVTVTANCAASNAEKTLIVGASSFVFSAAAGGGNPANQTFTLTPSIGTAAWTSAEVVAADWLTVNTQATSATGSATPAAPSTITLACTTGSLTAGNYTASVIFTAAGYTSVTVSVQFNVAAAAPTYNLYYSTKGVGIAPVAVLNGATTGALPYVWLAATSAPNLPITLSGVADTFKFWNTATTQAQETTVSPVRTLTTGQQAYPAGTPQLWEASSGPKNYHWSLNIGGVVSRGDASYNYGTTSTHAHAPGIWMRMDRQGGFASGGGGAGSIYLSTKEIAMIQKPAVRGIAMNIGWGTICPTTTTRNWAQIDALQARAKTYGKKWGVSVSHQGGWAPLPSNITSTLAQGGTPTAGALWDPNYYVRNVNWAHPTVSTGYKNMMRELFARYANDPDFIFFWTDEAWLEYSAAWHTATGTTKASVNTAYYKMLLDFANETPHPFPNKHCFIGTNSNYEIYAPGGNLDLLIDAGYGIGTPDAFNPTISNASTQRLMVRYRGRATGLLFGDGRTYRQDSTGTYGQNLVRAAWRQNVDETLSAPTYPVTGKSATTWPGISANGCWHVGYFGIMASLTWVQGTPMVPNTTFEADLAALLNEFATQAYPNSELSTNLANKV